MLQLARLIQQPIDVQIAAIRTGIAALEAENCAREFGLVRIEVANLLNLTPNAFQYRVRQNLRLNSLASERLLRLTKIANHAAAIFGDSAIAGNWLMQPHSLLDLATPLSMLDTAYGAQEVKRILCSIEYGLPV